MGNYKHTIVIETDLDEKDFKRAVETIWLTNSFSPGKLISFKTRSLVPNSTPTLPTPRYFTWIANVCMLLGWERLAGADLVEDVSWFGCFDDGMTPEAAIEEAKARGVLVSIEGKWVYLPKVYSEADKQALAGVCDTMTETLPKVSTERTLRSIIVGGDRSHELTQEPADGGGFASRSPLEDAKDGGK